MKIKKKARVFLGFHLDLLLFMGFCFFCFYGFCLGRPPRPRKGGGRRRRWRVHHLLCELVRRIHRKPCVQLVLILVLSRHNGVTTLSRSSSSSSITHPLTLHRPITHLPALGGEAFRELDPRRAALRRGARAPGATGRNLPEPGVVVHDLHLLAVKNSLANDPTLGLRAIPALEVDENTLVKIPVAGLPFHHVDAVDFSQLELVQHLPHTLLRDVREHTGNAKRRLRKLEITDRRHFRVEFDVFPKGYTFIYILSITFNFFLYHP